MIPLLKSLFSVEEDFSFDGKRQEAGLRQLLDTDSLVLVAELEGRVVGMCSGQIVISTSEGGPALLVEDVVVAGENRGRGIGRMLLQTLADRAAERGISRLQLLADRHNHAALAFYAGAGWQTTQLICLRTYIE